MKAYVIQRRDTGQYYKWRPYSCRWVVEVSKAKRYARRGDAANAIRLMRQPYSDNFVTVSDGEYRGNPLLNVSMLVEEYEMRTTGISWEYLP
jgi:hypothetical protein